MRAWLLCVQWTPLNMVIEDERRRPRAGAVGDELGSDAIANALGPDAVAAVRSAIYAASQRRS